MQERDTLSLWGLAWLGLTLALAVHVVDEAAHGFLDVWNPVVQSIRARAPWAPLPTFTFPVWLGGLAMVVLLLLSLSPLAYRGRSWMRPVSSILAIIMVGNAVGHLTVSAASGAWMPGAFSSPLLLAAALNLLWRAWASAPRAGLSSTVS